MAAAMAALTLVIVPPDWLPSDSVLASAVVLVTIAFLATGFVAEALTALLFFLAAMIFAVAPAEVVFSGFASSAFWIIFGGLILGMSIRHTGLGQHLAGRVLQRMPVHYPGVIAAVVALGLAFAFIMPGAMGRMVLLVPIALAVADRLGFEGFSNGRIGIVLAAIFGTHIGSFAILPSNTPNVVWSGAMETVHGISIGYLEYLWWHFPVLGILRSALLIAILVWLFPARLPNTARVDEPPEPMTKDQRRAAWTLLFALGFWATDFLHGIGPAWVALAAASYCLLMGPRLVPEKPFAALDVGPLLLVAGILGLGAVVAYQGIGQAAFVQLLPYLPLEPGANAVNYALISLGGVGLAILTTMPGVPAVGVPLGQALAEASGWSVKSVLVILAAAYSTYVMPYQAPPILIGAQLGRVPWGTLLRFTALFALLSMLLIFPLHFLWLRFIGLL